MVVLLTGCPDQAADIIEPKSTILDFDVAPLPDASLPGGDVAIDNLVLADFDLSRNNGDAFDRATDALPAYDEASADWIWGGPADASVDGRAPTLLQQTPVVVGTGLLVESPADQGGPYYNIWVSGVMEGLTPNTQYTVAFVRYGVDVKAELDQAAIMRGEPITQPDSLVVLNPNPLGDPNVDINFSTTGNEGDTIPAQPGGNPFIIGNATVDAGGVSDFGIMISATDAVTGGNPYFWTSEDTIPTAAMLDSAMFGRNDGVAFAPTSYNYIVMFEGLGVTGRTVARWQVAQDLDLNGDPLSNAFYPYPTDVFTLEELIAAPGGAGRPDSISVELFNAKPLAGSNVWQAWLVNRDESPITMIPAVSTYERVAIVRERDPITGEIISETDEILETVPGAFTFTGQLRAEVAGKEVPQEVKHRLIITDASIGGGSGPGFFTDVVFSQENGAASDPSDRTSTWFQYTDQGGTPGDYFDDVSASGLLEFGHFVLDDPATSVEFTAGDWIQTSGFGGTREDEVSVDVTNLPLPPVGFYYEGWLTGPNGNALSLGPITSLPPDSVSLYDADIDLNLPSVTATGIRFANVAAVVGPDAIVTVTPTDTIVNLRIFLLTLEPKLGFVDTATGSKNIADLLIGSLPIETIIDRLRSQ
jgi:hypothetical protein